MTWTCAGAQCPWGASLTGHAVVWPAVARAVSVRLGYTVSAEMYLPAVKANGATIAIQAGTATIHAGPAGEVTHRLLATVAAGQTFRVTGLANREVLSVQGEAEFSYRVTLPPLSEADYGEEPGAREHVIQAAKALWRCNVPSCNSSDWTGAVITWPAWAAYQSNGRMSDQSRSVFSTDGTPLYPYMGQWAQGCKVTAESGVVQIIEWQRGTDTWRDTWLFPGQSHMIDLYIPENGAMIETYESSPGFSVSLKNCTPQPVPQ